MADTQSNPALVAAEKYEKDVVPYSTLPYAAILLEHAHPQQGEQVLDVACGTGAVARLIAPRVGPTGAVTGVDINPAMLTVARSLPAPEGAAIDWREGSASALPVTDGAFDLVCCQAGLQFFPDRPAAVGEMVRVLRPGGRVAISVWRSIEHSPASKLVWEAIARRLNSSTAVLARQFSLGDAGELRGLLEVAGFGDVTITPRSHTIRQPHNPHLVAQLFSYAVLMLPDLAAMPAEEKETLAQAVEAEIGPEFQQYVDGDWELWPTAAHIALAQKR